MARKLLKLPGHGRLLVSTDLQGNLRDFRTIATRFEDLRAAGEDAYLLFTGDVVHGPGIAEADWPDHLGTFYRDESPQLVEELVALRGRYPERVHALLGNHEHAHVGGPPTSKFWDDEARHLEEIAGPERAARMRELFAGFPLVAVAPCGAVFTHGAPATALGSAEDVEAVEYGGHTQKFFEEILQVPVLGPVLWARWADPHLARGFAAALGGTICLYGHDVVSEGYERIGDEQLIFSTSYGLLDPAKVYVQLDLDARYTSVHQLREGMEIRQLYP